MRMPKKLSERDRSPFGQRLAQARRWAGKTQVEVCKHCGISQGSYSELEKDANNSRFTVQIADFLGVDPVWLATGAGNEPDWSRAHGQVAPVAHGADPDAELIAAIKTLDEMGKAQVMGFVAGLKQPRALGEFSTPKEANGH